MITEDLKASWTCRLHVALFPAGEIGQISRQASKDVFLCSIYEEMEGSVMDRSWGCFTAWVQTYNTLNAEPWKRGGRWLNKWKQIAWCHQHKPQATWKHLTSITSSDISPTYHMVLHVPSKIQYTHKQGICQILHACPEKVGHSGYQGDPSTSPIKPKIITLFNNLHCIIMTAR